MPPSQPLVSTLAVVAGLIAMVADGRRAVPVSVAVVGLALAPSAATTGGTGVLLLVGVGLAGAAGALCARLVASRAPWAAGLDPSVPVFAGGRELFGPRSVRVLVSALALPAASWVSFNAPIGAVATARGLLLPAAYIWICGALRLVVARTLADLFIGVVLCALGGGVAWLIRGGPDAFGGLAAASALAVAASVLSGWLTGRHASRLTPQSVAA